jgi:hypothetical protein
MTNRKIVSDFDAVHLNDVLELKNKTKDSFPTRHAFVGEDPIAFKLSDELKEKFLSKEGAVRLSSRTYPVLSLADLKESAKTLGVSTRDMLRALLAGGIVRYITPDVVLEHCPDLIEFSYSTYKRLHDDVGLCYEIKKIYL